MKRGLPMFEAPHVTITTPGFKALTLSMSVVTDDPTELLVKDLGDTKAELTQHGRAFCSSGMIRDGAAWRCVTMGPMSLTNRQLIPCWTPLFINNWLLIGEANIIDVEAGLRLVSQAKPLQPVECFGRCQSP